MIALMPSESLASNRATVGAPYLGRPIWAFPCAFRLRYGGDSLDVQNLYHRCIVWIAASCEDVRCGLLSSGAS